MDVRSNRVEFTLALGKVALLDLLFGMSQVEKRRESSDAPATIDIVVLQCQVDHVFEKSTVPRRQGGEIVKNQLTPASKWG
jgi:hypothetical protein